MLTPPPASLRPNDPHGGPMTDAPARGRQLSDPLGNPMPADPPGNPIPGGPLAYPRPGPLASPTPGGPLTSPGPGGPRGYRPGSPAGGARPGTAPTGLLPGDPIPGDPPGTPVETRPGPPCPPGALDLSAGRLATLRAQCPGLRVDQMLRHDGKSMLAAGYVGEQPVVIKMSAGTDPLWRLRQRHEIGVYLIFAEHPPPVRVPRLIHTDGESVVVTERLEGTPLDTGRYPERPLTEQEVRATTELVRALHRWQPLPSGFGPVFTYHDRIARYHAAGYLSDTDWRALDRLLARCGRPSQLNHGDPLPGNILSTTGGEWALLDWEFTGLFLPGFDLAMLQILLARAPAATGHIEAIVAETGHIDAYLVNLAVVLSRERHIHHELHEDHPLRIARLPALETAWLRARDRIHAAASRGAS
jgi:aminoglycoside phosphotransferase (APT) family kinase protein